MSWKAQVAAITAGAVLVVGAIGIAACGDGDDSSSEEAKETDGAFVAEMVEHHELAIEMAEMALDRGEHPEIEELARSIITLQGREIEELGTVHERLFGEPVAEADHGTLGLSAAEMGVHEETGALETARPFDREFIDMMVPHHQGAIRMARIELERGEDEHLKGIAEAIITAQSGEIEVMNEWRRDWYGAPSPAGGVPPEGEAEAPSHEEMGH